MNNLTPYQQTMLATWQQHTHAEFVLKDADAALVTMTEDPYVFAIPAGTGGSGRAGVREFYANQFLPNIRRISNSTLCRRPSATTGSSRNSWFALPIRLTWIGCFRACQPPVEEPSSPSWVSLSSKPAKWPASVSIGIRPRCSPSWESWIIRWRRPELAARRNSGNFGTPMPRRMSGISRKPKPKHDP